MNEKISEVVAVNTTNYLIVNAILYLNKTGIQWELMPNDFPPWKTVYDHFRKWKQAGIWEKVLDFLNEEFRVQNGKKKLLAMQ
ncbi:MAG: transposase [Mesoflavibacter sp.]|nr:transposase [Mesoflavibacter sp.]